MPRGGSCPQITHGQTQIDEYWAVVVNRGDHSTLLPFSVCSYMISNPSIASGTKSSADMTRATEQFCVQED